MNKYGIVSFPDPGLFLHGWNDQQVTITYYSTLHHAEIKEVFEAIIFVKRTALLQGCHGQGKYLENEIFSRSGKSENFVDGQGDLERIWKV